MSESQSSKTPVLQAPRPAFRVGPFPQAIAHYVDWLGFRVDWEWREAPGQPAVAALSRDHCAFMINEHPDATGPVSLHVDVSNLQALASEWNARQPHSVVIEVGQPYEIPQVTITDPWGNVLHFEGKDELAEQERLSLVRSTMRNYVQARLAAGDELPTPEVLRDAVGPPLGAAIEVLNEFPGYGKLFDTRKEADT